MHLYDNDLDFMMGIITASSWGAYPNVIPSNIGKWRAYKITADTQYYEELTLGKCSETTLDEMYSYWIKRNLSEEFI